MLLLSFPIIMIAGVLILGITFGPEHQNTLQSMDSLATVFSIQKQFAQAESLYTLVLTIKEKEVGSDHPDIVPSLKNLAGKMTAPNLQYKIMNIP